MNEIAFLAVHTASAVLGSCRVYTQAIQVLKICECSKCTMNERSWQAK